jgi:GntR family transcriptional regulator
MTFVPDRNSKVPLYRQLGDYLISQIIGSPEQGEWLLLPEREMSCAYGVSRSTIRQALQYVEARRFITRKRGSGTYVVEQKPATSLMHMYSYTKEIERMGKVPSSRLISLKVRTDCSTSVLRSLDLSQGDKTYELRRLRFADDEIKMYETTYLPYKLLPGLDSVDLAAESLYATLLKKYHISLQTAIQEFEVTSASQQEAELLGIEYNEPVMLTIRTSCDGNHQPIEYSRCVIPRGGMRYSVELKI